MLLGPCFASYHSQVCKRSIRSMGERGCLGQANCCGWLPLACTINLAPFSSAVKGIFRPGKERRVYLAILYGRSPSWSSFPLVISFSNVIWKTHIQRRMSCFLFQCWGSGNKRPRYPSYWIRICKVPCYSIILPILGSQNSSLSYHVSSLFHSYVISRSHNRTYHVGVGRNREKQLHTILCRLRSLY